MEQSARAASRVRRLPSYQEAWPEMKQYLRDLRSRLNRTRKTALRALPLATSESHRRDLQQIVQQTSQEIDQLLQPQLPETAASLCDQAVLELAYASGLRLAELRNIRLEQLQLEAGFVNVIGKGNKQRVVPLGRKAVEALRRYLAHDRLDRRGAADTIAPQEAHDLAGIDMHIDALQDMALAVVGVQIPDFQHQAASSPR